MNRISQPQVESYLCGGPAAWQPGEAIYDPSCGSGGMLISSITHLRKQNKEWRTVKLFGQERNLMTSSSGEREVQKALRKTLLKYKLHTDQKTV